MKRIYILLAMLFACVNFSNAGWFMQSSPVTTNLRSVIFNHGNENQVWACGENGVILYTSNGGINWAVQNSGTVNDLNAIVFMEISGAPVFAVGNNGTILRTANNGLNWAPIISPVNKDLNDISDFNFLIAGDSGTILKSTNQGLNWFVVSTPGLNNLNAVCTTFGYYAVGDDGTVIKGLNGGLNWSLLSTGINNNFYGIPLFGGIDIAVGSSGMILKSTNFGNNWFSQNPGTAKTIRSVEYSVNNTSRIYCVGDSGLIIKTTNSGVSWGTQVSPSQNNLNSVFFYLDDNTGYAVGNNGTILKTTDGGGQILFSENTNFESPRNYFLQQNYPNPFNPETVITLGIPASGYVSLTIFNSLGEEIAMLNNGNLIAGVHTFKFDGSLLSGGIYFYRLKAGNFSITKKMILLK